LGNEQQMVLEMRPAHDPTKAYGFVGVVVSLKDLSASVWLWHRNNGAWDLKKVIEIPAEPADPEKLPPMLKDFKAVPPLVTDINLSLDDKFLYVSCWGTGEFIQYDVSDRFTPQKTGSVRIGGIVNRTPHPKNPNQQLAGCPQMVEGSRDGAWAAGTETRSGASGVAADRTGPRAFHWDYHWRCSGGSNQPAAFSPEIFRRGHSVCVWIIPSFPVASPQLGGHASGFWRFDSLVVYHGISTRRRIDAYPIISQTSGRAARN